MGINADWACFARLGRYALSSCQQIELITLLLASLSLRLVGGKLKLGKLIKHLCLATLRLFLVNEIYERTQKVRLATLALDATLVDSNTDCTD